MKDSKAISTPSDVNVTLVKAGEDCEKVFPYRQAVGSLMYAATVSRPDISYAVGEVSRFMDNPNQQHIGALKRILRYLNHSKTMVITYGSNELGDLIGFTDADFARDIDTRRSTTGYVFMLGNGAITWKSKRQKTVALSTTEAEYMAACDGAREAVWLRQLMKDVGYEQERPTTMNIDNQSAILLIKNPELHHRTKHIDVRLHFIRDLYEDSIISAEYIETGKQLADVFTKPLASNVFNSNIFGLGMEKAN